MPPEKPSQQRILIVEDEDNARKGYEALLRKWSFEVLGVASGEEALAKFQDFQPSVILADVELPGMNGLDLLAHLGEEIQRIPVIIITGRGSDERVVQAIDAGAYWYIEKPLKPPVLRALLDRAFGRVRDQQAVAALTRDLRSAGKLGVLVGTSPAMQDVMRQVEMAAPSTASVLITGETGSGKEMVARSIHMLSPRAERPFVAINCSAIPESLMESEIFGHEKGAFTGAMQRRLGRFELAEGGTIFLDEIGELPAETQISLLRVLQEREFERVGGTGSIRTNVRVIAATNRDLEAAIAAGMFRSDLFYRLNVFPIEVPPLRKRREDIPMLASYFIDRFARKAGKSIRSVNKTTMELLQSYPWPGNIRELQNVIERSVIVCDTESFSVDESWLSLRPLASKPKSQPELSRTLADEEKEMIEAALLESGGRVSGPSGAAVRLGIPGSTLESKIRSLKIDKYRFKS